MLLIHAAAIPGLTAARKGGHLHDGVARTGVSVLILGVALFAGDLTMRAFTGAGLFPLAAPSGGIAMIAGWAMVALAALMPPAEFAFSSGLCLRKITPLFDRTVKKRGT